MNSKFITNIKIAWRNLWRNKRRTLITVSSIFFAVFFAILMRSFQIGTYSHMIDNIVTKFSGHLQIQDVEYLDNQSIDYSIPFTDSLINILNNNTDVEFYFPRIQSGALSSSGENSKFAVIMGVDYQKENELIDFYENIALCFLDTASLNSIAKNMDQKNADVLLKYKNRAYSNSADLREDLFADGLDTSKYLGDILNKTKLPDIKYNKYGQDVFVGYKLALYLELGIGDSIILMGQGYAGTTAVGKYRIIGFLNFPADMFNDRFIYMPIHTAQTFLSAYKINNDFDTTYYVNYIAVNTVYQASIKSNDYDRILKVKADIENEIKNPLITVLGWHNLNKDLIEGIEMDNGSGKIMIFVLYLIIAFGVLGTVMMMIAERKREFGMMMAIGMQRKQLSFIVSIEMFFMGIIAAVLGIIVTAPIIWIGHNHPIRLRGDQADSMDMYNMEPVLPLHNFDTYVVAQLAVVAIIVAVVLVYALLKIRKLKVISALKS
ncbi:MAG: ABC transporter permease [Bacteroidales bacterium]|nr:ABC transporter permease [Bacteroidales bacterium]